MVTYRFSDGESTITEIAAVNMRPDRHSDDHTSTTYVDTHTLCRLCECRGFEIRMPRCHSDDVDRGSRPPAAAASININDVLLYIVLNRKLAFSGPVYNHHPRT
jgi:hypothetical protein